MKGYRTLSACLSAAIVLGLAVAGVGAAGAEPLKIRVGWVVTPGHLAPLIEELGKRHPEVFKHLGKSYVMDAVHFQGTTPEIQAQAINELEVASFSSAALALAITNAHLDERLVADVVGDGMNGYFSEHLRRARRWSDQTGGRHQGQARRDQHDRLGRRRGDAHDAPPPRPQGQRLHHRRG